ncbi:MAG: hypothetical protein KIT84_06235 [Labilithrix sp.]|nr:hypothetical protein [Labilithrix sp.]MCW5810590.1 hypothetical protein [Labilithrix sp.]
MRHEYLLDPASAMVPGRGVQKSEGGSFTVLPTRCAAERGSREEAKVDASTIDFSYIGVAIDHALVSADADVAPWLNAGAEAAEHKVSLVAVAFVRELDPQFFGASEEVSFGGEACACGRATHFVGAVKMGGLISYEMTVKSAEVRGRALDFVKAKIAAGDARITQTVVGGLEVEGLDSVATNASGDVKTKPLGFKVRTPVPIAYAVYPLADVCKFAFPAPEVSPETLDFGEVPYDREETRLLHVVNRASIDLRATVGERTFAVSALGSVDVPLAWRPTGATVGCEQQTREDTVQFYPRDENVPVTPKVQSTRIVSKVRTGKGTWSRHEHVDSGTGRKPDYASTKREWSCPPDYVVSSCATRSTQCGDGKCTTDGYAVNAEPGANGCRFSCKGPESLIPGLSSNFCRFDAVMECRLRCGGAPPPAPVASAD